MVGLLLYKEATTVTLAGIVFAQVVNVFVCRSDRSLNIPELGGVTNPLILWGIAFELTILMVLIYTPLGHNVFGTRSLPMWIFVPLTFRSDAAAPGGRRPEMDRGPPQRTQDAHLQQAGGA